MKRARRIEFFFEIARIVVAMVIAYLLCVIVLAVVTDNPGEAVYLFSVGPFTTRRRFGMLMSKFIPYILTGLGMCFIYACNRFSMVGDGVYMFAGCISAFMAVNSVSWGLPHVLTVALILLTCTILGALLGSVPVLMQEKFNANEVVISIMMNYLLTYFSNYLLKTKFRDPEISYLGSKIFPASAKLTEFIPRSTIHTGLFISLFMVVVVGVIFNYTALGYSIRLCGENPHFAKYSGIRISSSIVTAECMGIALCGLGGAVDMLGLYDRYVWAALPGYGSDGLLVAVLSRKNPWLIPLGAFLLAYLRTGASILNVNTEVPLEFVQVAQSVIILLIAAQEFMGGLKNRIIVGKDSPKKETVKGA